LPWFEFSNLRGTHNVRFKKNNDQTSIKQHEIDGVFQDLTFISPYVIDHLGDTIIEYEGQGIDTVISPFDYTLAANVDNLTLTGVALNGTGNVLDNVMVGTDADNTLIGLEGKDTLDGGAKVISSERWMCSVGNFDRLRAASNKGRSMFKKNLIRKAAVCRRSYSLVRYEYSSDMTPHRRRPLRVRDVPANAQVGGRKVAMQDLTPWTHQI